MKLKQANTEQNPFNFSNADLLTELFHALLPELSNESYKEDIKRHLKLIMPILCELRDTHHEHFDANDVFTLFRKDALIRLTGDRRLSKCTKNKAEALLSIYRIDRKKTSTDFVIDANSADVVKEVSRLLSQSYAHIFKLKPSEIYIKTPRTF